MSCMPVLLMMTLHAFLAALAAALMCQLARGAVNAAGTSYSVDAAGNIVVAACPQDTYGPGMKKQRSCVLCPPGYTTNGATGQTTDAACGESWSCETPLAASRVCHAAFYPVTRRALRC